LSRPRPILVEFFEKGLIKKGAILDICCGAGTNALYLAKKGFEVTGGDISQRAIELAKEKAENAKVKIDFIKHSFVNLSVENETFDLVFDMGCFHHVKIDDRIKFIKEVHRVLKKGGDHLLTCFSYKNGQARNHFTERQIITFFSGHFDIEEIRDVSSIESDGVRRYFYTVWMKKKT
jgi:ubiquinone/menaquinone biosynthesis C-methylase UbiE